MAKSNAEEVLDHLQRMFPRANAKERQAIAELARHSRGLRHAHAPNAAWLAALSYIRHYYTDYDALLAEGYDRDAARYFVLEAINLRLEAWGCRQRLLPSEPLPPSP